MQALCLKVKASEQFLDPSAAPAASRRRTCEAGEDRSVFGDDFDEDARRSERRGGDEVRVLGFREGRVGGEVEGRHAVDTCKREVSHRREGFCLFTVRSKRMRQSIICQGLQPKVCADCAAGTTNINSKQRSPWLVSFLAR